VIEEAELDRFLTCDMGSLIAHIKGMSAIDCENYAKAILARIGGPTLDQYLGKLVEMMIPEGGGTPSNNPDEYYWATRSMFPNISTEEDVLGRLAAVVMKMCVLRLQQSPGPNLL
jgi:hypothetical protein